MGETADSMIERIAELAHEINRAYCKAIGDDSQLLWSEAPNWQRDSARTGVRAISEGKITRPRESHESWLAEKEREGWRYGETKNPQLKTHPCILPFDQLPLEQRVKDHLFFATVTTAFRMGI